MNSDVKLLRDLVHYRTYAKYIPELKRRETWNETVDRKMNMDLERFPNLTEDIIKAYQYVREFKVMPSMRGMQFAGAAIKKNNLRIFNCSYVAIDNVRVFDEILFLLLSGVGVGVSVRLKHINDLPSIKEPVESNILIAHDSIEGWAQCLQILMEAYFFKRIRPEFDFSKIREKGSYLSTTGARAPGPKPLIRMLEIVEEKLKLAIGRKLEPIEAHDIVCIIADCVLAGGIRRAALLSLFSPSDKEMLSCKTGNWMKHSPWRARANNSVSLVRSTTTKEEFKYIFNICRDSGYGEPGFIWTSDESFSVGNNPCQPGFATVLTPNGIRTFNNIKSGSIIWSGTKWCRVNKKWSTGIKSVYKYKTTMGEFIGTENHRILQNNTKIEICNASSIDCNKRIDKIADNKLTNSKHAQSVMDGLIIGDGTIHKANNNLILLNIEEKDSDYFSSKIKDLILKNRNKSSPKAYEVKTTILCSELPNTFDRKIPDRFFYANDNMKCAFLRGLYSANGSVVRSTNRIQLKKSSEKLIYQVQLMLSSLGIGSYITSNIGKKVKFSNGEYQCKDSYNVNITYDRHKFISNIGFIQEYKYLENIKGNQNKFTSDIISKEYLGELEVYNINVDDENHTYWTGGCLVSNCAEVALKAKNFCNLVSINQSNIETKEELLERTWAATLIGTLQTAYTDFSYVRDDWKETTESTRLLGVSFTGIADNYKVAKKGWLKEAAEYALAINSKYANRIGVKKADRVCVIKPEGSVSALIGTSSGIHPRYSDYYIRRVRMNKDDTLALFLKDRVPNLVEDDLYSDSGCVVSLPQASPDGAIMRNSESALELFDRAMIYFNSWIKPGHREGVDYNNVSLTLYVKDNEYDEVFEAMWKNRFNYNGVSLFPYSNNKYKQAPFEEIDKDNYNQMKKYIENANIDFSDIKETYTFNNFGDLVACGAGGCNIL